MFKAKPIGARVLHKCNKTFRILGGNIKKESLFNEHTPKLLDEFKLSLTSVLPLLQFMDRFDKHWRRLLAKSPIHGQGKLVSLNTSSRNWKPCLLRFFGLPCNASTVSGHFADRRSDALHAFQINFKVFKYLSPIHSGNARFFHSFPTLFWRFPYQ